uniref:Uncharacterized protein n=1 Tax=Ascaris lumbricoides TaxID=6252 RepID=A0A0M3ICM5_ASCLU
MKNIINELKNCPYPMISTKYIYMNLSYVMLVVSYIIVCITRSSSPLYMHTIQMMRLKQQLLTNVSKALVTVELVKHLLSKRNIERSDHICGPIGAHLQALLSFLV